MIRTGHIEDLPAVMRLVRAWPQHFVPASYSFIEKDFANLASLVWEEDGEVCGFLIWMSNAYEIEMLWLAVSPGASRRGIATELVNAVESLATTQQIIMLKTATPDSIIPESEFSGLAYSATIAFFESLGFRVAGRLESYWGIHNHCCVFIKSLAR